MDKPTYEAPRITTVGIFAVVCACCLCKEATLTEWKDRQGT